MPTSAIEWDIEWGFNCGNSPGSFEVTVEGFGKAADTTDTGVFESGDFLSGHSPNFDTGQFQLMVTTLCGWHINIVMPYGER